MNRSNWVTGVIVVILIIVAVGIYLYPEPVEAETIKIGTILQLTGFDAQYGDWARKGVDIAVTEVNNQDGVDGRLLEVIHEDSECLS